MGSEGEKGLDDQKFYNLLAVRSLPALTRLTWQQGGRWTCRTSTDDGNDDFDDIEEDGGNLVRWSLEK